MSTQALTPNPGKWEKGYCPNPKGRPKHAKSLTDALRRLVEDGAADKIAANVIYLATKARQEAVQVKAAEFIADRLEGRPMQAIAMLQVMDDNTAQRLVQLATLLTGNALSQNETPILEASAILETVESTPKLPPKPSRRARRKSAKSQAETVVTSE